MPHRLIRKASLLEAFLGLPYEILIPNTLFEEELVRFTQEQKDLLIQGGLQVMDLPGESVLRALALAAELPHLSIHDSFAYALAEGYKGCILLTGDGRLRALAIDNGMEVHGVLWVIDEIHAHGLASAEDLLKILRVFAEDTSVRLPRRELAAQVRRYSKSS